MNNFGFGPGWSRGLRNSLYCMPYCLTASLPDCLDLVPSSLTRTNFQAKKKLPLSVLASSSFFLPFSLAPPRPPFFPSLLFSPHPSSFPSPFFTSRRPEENHISFKDVLRKTLRLNRKSSFCCSYWLLWTNFQIPAPLLTLFFFLAIQGHGRTIPAIVAAKANGLELEIIETAPGKVAHDIHPLGKTPAFVGTNGFKLHEAVAIAIYSMYTCPFPLVSLQSSLVVRSYRYMMTIYVIPGRKSLQKNNRRSHSC